MPASSSSPKEKLPPHGKGKDAGGRGRRRERGGPPAPPALPTIRLTPDQWLDVIGYTLLLLAGLTLLSFVSANHGAIPAWWLGVLLRGFGWGAYLTPLIIGAVGLWLVLRRFGDRLPRITPLQTIGAALGYLALLTTLHLLAAYLRFEGNLWVTAEAKMGGGLLGAALSQMLIGGLGGVGAIIALITWWLTALAFSFGATVKDGVQAAQRLWQRTRVRPRLRTRPLPTPPSERVSTAPPLTGRIPTIPTHKGTPHVPLTAPQQPVAEPSPVRVGLAGNLHEWKLPSTDEILEPGSSHDVGEDILRQQARIIETTLESLGAPVRVKEVNRGPVVTQFGVEPLMVPGPNGKETRVKVSRIAALANDIALALEAKTLRVEAPIPGKGLVGLEVPNPEISLVALRDIMESEQFASLASPLKLCLGQDVSGVPVVADLTAMPHLLIAGTTGSGKSVCINAIIAALLMQQTPAELKFLMVDPKRVELTGYSGIPHLISKVVVEMERVTGALQWVLDEMDRRYRHFSKVRATHIRDYNERIAPTLGEKKLPYIVVIIDELADLMMMAAQESERAICRIAQMARATGIHLILATQRPSVDVVTGLIKANFPARIAFNVASTVDSRVILDMPGAEQLLGRGDMLFLPPDSPTPIRLQGAFVSDDELRRLVQYWKDQARPEAVPAEKTMQQPLWEDLKKPQPEVEYEDELLPDVVEVLMRENRISVSLLQRKLHIGYTRAARIMDILEQHGVVGPQPPGGKAREVFPRAAQALLTPKKKGG